MSQEEDELTVLRIRENIKKITRSQLSEIQAWGHPPVTIQRVMRATYAVLGETPAELVGISAYLQSLGYDLGLRLGEGEYPQHVTCGLWCNDVEIVRVVFNLIH